MLLPDHPTPFAAAYLRNLLRRMRNDDVLERYDEDEDGTTARDLEGAAEALDALAARAARAEQERDTLRAAILATSTCIEYRGETEVYSLCPFCRIQEPADLEMVDLHHDDEDCIWLQVRKASPASEVVHA